LRTAIGRRTIEKILTEDQRDEDANVVDQDEELGQVQKTPHFQQILE